MSALPEVKKGISRIVSVLVSAIKKVFWKHQTFPSLPLSKKLVMAIATVLAFETDMVIVTVLIIKTVMVEIIVEASSGIKPAIQGLRHRWTSAELVSEAT